MLAFITIEGITKHDPGFVKFKSKNQTVWNCNKSGLFEDETGELMWRPGQRLKVDFNTTNPTDGRKPSRYINNARPANEDDPAKNGLFDGDVITEVWEDKEPYQGGGGGGYSGGGGGKRVSNEDPKKQADIHRQVAAKCAMEFFTAGNPTVADLESNFADVANVVLQYIEGAPKSDAGGAGGTSDGAAGGSSDYGDF